MIKIGCLGRGCCMAGVSALALMAAACNRGQSTAQSSLDALPLTQVSTASTPAPAATALPLAPPARIARVASPQDRYAYLDRAYAMSRAFADAPPDYAVDYQGERPWIWRGADHSMRVVERTPEGLRYFYYEPGAERPYLVQDPQGYSYGYSDEELTTVYSPDGRLEPYDVVARRAAIAGRYLAWAAALQAASLRQDHQAVEQAHWDERRAEIAAERSAWAAQQSRQDAWAAYHQAHDADQQAHWAEETARRKAEAASYAQTASPPPQPLGPPRSIGGATAAGPAAYDGRGLRDDGERAGPPRPTMEAAGAATDAALGQRQANRAADANAARAVAEQAHAAQSRQVHEEAEAQAARAAALTQARDHASAEHAAASDAHAAQAAAIQHGRQAAAAAYDQRRATLSNVRAEADAERHAGASAHAAQAEAADQQAAHEEAPHEQPARAPQAQHGPPGHGLAEHGRPEHGPQGLNVQPQHEAAPHGPEHAPGGPGAFHPEHPDHGDHRRAEPQ